MATDRQNKSGRNKKIAIWCITPGGIEISQKLLNNFRHLDVYASLSLETKIKKACAVNWFEILSTAVAEKFRNYQAHIFIFATGIAVRVISSLLDNKMKDPGVVVIDDRGRFAISLVSGHLGGANLLAEKLADCIQATPVITTATDANKRPAIDMIAREKGLIIETPQNIKHINMLFLTAKKIKLYDPENHIKSTLGAQYWEDVSRKDIQKADVYCAYTKMDVSRETLILRPQELIVGLGCNRGTSFADIYQFLSNMFHDHGLSIKSIRLLATTRFKKNEKGFLMLSDALEVPLQFFENNALGQVKDVPSPSSVVERHLGVKSVCEASAILASGNGRLIVTKKKNKDVTLAVAIKK